MTWMFRILAATIASATAVPAHAQQIGKDYRQVGGWDVETVTAGGKFFGCRANFKSSTGVVGILRYANGKWVVTFPSLPHNGGAMVSGVMNFGGLTQPFNIKVSQNDLREAIPLDAGNLDRLRRAADIEIVVEGKRYAFKLAQVATAIGAVEDCWKEAGKGAGPAASAGAAKTTTQLYRQVGPWKVQTVLNASKTLHRCRAAFNTKDGEVSLIGWPNGKWSIGIPNLGWPAGRRSAARLSSTARRRPSR